MDITISRSEGYFLRDQIVSGIVIDLEGMFNKKFSQLSINQVSDSELLEINKSFLNHDYYTDIITFDYGSNGIIEGELYLSYDMITSNAKSRLIHPIHECYRLVCHGLLHLVGLNDKSDTEKKIMRQSEDRLLQFHVEPCLHLN